MNSSKIQHLLFDMGGVLVKLDWQRIISLLNTNEPRDKIHDIWGHSHSAVQFETGKIDFNQFCQQFITEHQLTLDQESFATEFTHIILGDFEETEALLQQVSSHYSLHLLSNTNSCHWQRLQQISCMFRYLDQIFTSFQLNIMKPDIQIYQHVIERLQCSPENILFFDDGKENVLNARKVGIHAEQVFGPSDIRKKLLNAHMLQ